MVEMEIKEVESYEPSSIMARTGGAFIDTIFLAIVTTLLLFFSVCVILPNISVYQDSKNLVDSEQCNSAIYYLDNTDKKTIDSDSYYIEESNIALKDKYSKYLILNRLEYCYLSYLTGNNLATGYEANKDKDVAWIDNKIPRELINIKYINTKVFGISEGELSSTYFITTDIENKLAEIKDEYITISEGKTVVNENVTKYIVTQCNKVVNLIATAPSYSSASNAISIASNLTIFITLFVSGIVIYLLVPLCNKKGQTFGKMIVRVGLIHKNGEPVKKYQLLLRFIPYTICVAILALLPLINAGLYIVSIVVPIIILLISIGLFSIRADQKALHDYIALTVVIDTKNK